MLTENQGEDGAWEPNWSWYQFEEVWPSAKEEWKGVLTLNALRTLRNFDRIEGYDGKILRMKQKWLDSPLSEPSHCCLEKERYVRDSRRILAREANE